MAATPTSGTESPRRWNCSSTSPSSSPSPMRAMRWPTTSRRSHFLGRRGLCLRALRDHLGLDQLRLVRLRLRHRRLVLSAHDDGADDRRGHLCPRSPGDVRLHRARRSCRQPGRRPGHVVMRVAMLTQWLRAARQCPSRRGTCIAYAVSIALAQLGWVVTAIVDTFLNHLRPDCWGADRRGVRGSLSRRASWRPQRCGLHIPAGRGDRGTEAVLAYEVRGHEHQAAALARQSDQHG